MKLDSNPDLFNSKICVLNYDAMSKIASLPVECRGINFSIKIKIVLEFDSPYANTLVTTEA